MKPTPMESRNIVDLGMTPVLTYALGFENGMPALMVATNTDLADAIKEAQGFDPTPERVLKFEPALTLVFHTPGALKSLMGALEKLSHLMGALDTGETEH